MKNYLARLTIVILLLLGVAIYFEHLAITQLVADCGNGSLTNFPTFADGVTDDAPAFRQSFEALAQCGGGTLHVPAGKFAVESNVTTNFLHRAQKIIVRGNGSSSQIHIATGPTVDAFVMQDVDSLWTGLMFVGGGIEGAGTQDALTVISISGGRGKFEHDFFVGLGAITSSHSFLPATIRFDNGAWGAVNYNQFWGCRSISAYPSGTIVADNYSGFEAIGNIFLDYTRSNVNGHYYSTNSQANYAWILLLSPYQDTQRYPMETSGAIVIEKNHFDEGAAFAVAITPRTGTAVNRVQLNNNSMNVGVGAGYALYNIKHLTIDGGFSGLHTTGSQVDAIQTFNVTYVMIKDFEVSPITLANRLRVDFETRMLRIVDSAFPVIINNAQAWRIENGASVSSFPAEKLQRSKLAF